MTEKEFREKVEALGLDSSCADEFIEERRRAILNNEPHFEFEDYIFEVPVVNGPCGLKN